MFDYSHNGFLAQVVFFNGMARFADYAANLTGILSRILCALIHCLAEHVVCACINNVGSRIGSSKGKEA